MNLNTLAVVVGPTGCGKAPTTTVNLKEPLASIQLVDHIIDVPTVNSMVTKLSETGPAYFVNTEFHEIEVQGFSVSNIFTSLSS